MAKESRKTWKWKKINIGEGWTLISTECYLRRSCDNCIYYRYCGQTRGEIPVLKQVVEELLKKHGKPDETLIEKAHSLEL